MKKVEPDLLFLRGSFTKIAAAISKNFNVRIVPSGFDCSTDGETINIPFNSDYLSEARRELLNGCLDHEVCHVSEERVHRESGQPTPMVLLKAEENTTIRMLLNAFEDIRIERKYSVRYPGMAENLCRLNQDTVLKFLAESDRSKKNFWHEVGCYLIFAARNLPTDWLAGKPLWASKLLADELEEAKKTIWAQDCLGLARRVYEKLKDAHEELSKPKEGSCEAPDLKEAVPGEGSGESVLIELGEADIDDLISLAKRTLAKHALDDAEVKNTYVPNPLAKKEDKWYVPPSSATNMATYDNAKESVQRQIGVMKAKQLAYYQTISRRKVVGGLEQGALEDSELTSVRFGNRNVFCDTRRGRLLDTSIEFLIDLSGSMGDNRMEHSPAYWALRTSIALAEAWEGLRIPYEMIGFDNTGWPVPSPPTRGMISRPPFRYPIFKGWNERLSNCRSRFAHIQGRENNADGEAVMAAAQRLAVRREARRLLIVISDGEPCCPGMSSGEGGKYLSKVVREISRVGIEVIGIGAGTDVVKKFYSKENGASSIVIKDLDKLAITVFSHLQDKMKLRAA